MRVVLYNAAGLTRAKTVADAMAVGLKRHGIRVSYCNTKRANIQGDVAIAYGWNHRPIFEKHAQYVYFDLGYWNRHPAKRPREGMYRVAVNSWDTADHMLDGMPDDRFVASDLVLWPHEPRDCRRIMIALMSDKAAIAKGMRPREWEKKAAIQIRGEGFDTSYRYKTDACNLSIEKALAQVQAVISYSSNVSVDALINGVPSYSELGVGRLWSLYRDGGTLSNPYFPDDAARHQLLSDVAYAQWSPSEMRNGSAWDYIRQVLK